ncbi:MAG: hypothetical protein ACLPLP_15785 [Mycobacterium sp.]
MTLVRAKSEERVPRVFRRPFAKPSNFPVQIDFANHPTLLEISQRQKEIEAWEAMNVGGYRFAKPGTIIGFLISAAMVVVALTPIPPNWPWNIPLVMLAISTAVATAVFGLLWFGNPDIGPRPESLTIVPFSRAENLHLMNGQALEPYRATCTCPGCGDLSTHLIRRPADDEPDWAIATRRCGVCAREWAQA